MCYLAGELELMSPSRNHERIKAMFGRLLWVWAEERGVALNAYGSWTLKSEPDARGAEPDDCYVVGDRDAEVPDLAIEVVWTSGGLDKLAVYAPLGVREVWTWSEGRLAVHVLRAGRYVAATAGARCSRGSTSRSSCASSIAPTRPPRRARTARRSAPRRAVERRGVGARGA